MQVNTDIVSEAEKRADRLVKEPSVLATASARTASAASEVEHESVIESGASRTAVIAKAATEGRDLSQRVSNLSFGGVVPSETEFERILGSNDLVDEFYLQRALIAARPVCRLVVRNPAGKEIGYATGCMVSPQLVLTNWHVFKQREQAENGIAEFDFKLDIRGNPSPSTRFLLRPDQFYHSNRMLDYALVAVEVTSTDGRRRLSEFGFHKLIAEANKIWEGEWITIIQHPGGQRRQFSIRENQLFEKQDQFLWYASDTAPGSSGAPAFNDSFQIVALHHSGKAKKENEQYILKDGSRVNSLDNVDDSMVDWVANEGLRISVLCRDIDTTLPKSNNYIQEFFAGMKEGDIMSDTLSGDGNSTRKLLEAPENETMVERKFAPQTNIASRTSVSSQTIGSNGITIPLNLHISLSYGDQPRDMSTRSMVSAGYKNGEGAITEEPGVEKVPFVDRDYDNRKGYDEMFLKSRIPLPKVLDETVVSTMENGEHVIPYEHFSVVVHRERKLALFTASNVDGSEKKRKPEGRKYTRRELGELGQGGTETWLVDPRISQHDQLPDRFYTKDRGSFDKGHIVRREDVCWGSSKAQIKRANGDTYHVTNCSPQVSDFNQSGKQGIWGMLENYVLQQVNKDKCTIFAGPLLDDDFKNFVGFTDTGTMKVKIPKKFWKIIISVEDDGSLKAFGFLLEQSLKNVPRGVIEDEEFVVSEEWIPYMVSIEELEEMIGIVEFPRAIKEADQSEEAAGSELLSATEIRRRR